MVYEERGFVIGEIYGEGGAVSGSLDFMHYGIVSIVSNGVFLMLT